MNTTTPAHATFIHQDDPYIDYEICHELPRFDDAATRSIANEHSISIRFTYDIDEGKSYGIVTYKRNGSHQELGTLNLTKEQFYRITNHPLRPEDKLATIRSVEGNITIHHGVATLPDGTQIPL